MMAIFVSQRGMLNNVRKLISYIGSNSLVFLALNQLVIYIIKSYLKIIIYNKIMLGIITLIITIVTLVLLNIIINKYFKIILGRF